MKLLSLAFIAFILVGCSPCKEQRGNELQLDCHVREWQETPKKDAHDGNL